MHLYCPCCSGTMQRYIGNIVVRCGLYEAAHIRQGEYIICNECPVSSEVDTRTGLLLDLGAVSLVDLLHPTDQAITFVVAAPGRLDGRTDS
jgi:hypothetical protein